MEKTRGRVFWETIKRGLGVVKAENATPEEVRRFIDDNAIVGSVVRLSPGEMRGKSKIFALFSRIEIDSSEENHHSS